MEVPHVGIVVPVFNQVFYTEKFIHSVLKQKVESCQKLVLVIVDNASTDETEAVIAAIKEEHKQYISNIRIEYIKLLSNFGYGVAANVGISYLDDSYRNSIDYIICNNDMELLEKCIDSLIECAYSQDDCGIVGGKLQFPDGTIQHAGAFLNIFGWGQHKNAQKQATLTIPRDRIAEQEYVTGALFYVKNELMCKVRGFDERFAPAYFEEVDFCYYARTLGYKTLYTPFANAIHYENVTGKKVYGNQANLKKEISDVNQIKFYIKQDDFKSAEVTYTADFEDRILLTGKIYGDWSFSGVLRNLAKGLNRAGVDVAIAPEEYHNIGNMPDWEIKAMINKPKDYWNRVVLRSSEGDHMYLLPPGKMRIAHTTGESTYVNKDWLQQLNAVDLVLTTSNFYANVLKSHGLKTPVSVLPNSVNFDIYNRNIETYPMQVEHRDFNFFSMFHFGERKAPEILVKAFIEEFSPNDSVSLTLHSLSIGYVLQQRGMDMAAWLRYISPKTPAPIYVSQNPIPEDVLPHYIKYFDCFVLPTRGEGFGLPILECGAMGIPSIVTGHSGVLDLVDEKTGWLIDNKLVDIPLQYLTYFKNYIGGQWAEPSVEHLRTLMRYAFEHPEEVKQKGEAMYTKSLNYSVEAIGKKARSLIFSK